ncbi:MAG: 23S rRNA (guanosine(2251)-2'-O)-methyltransferase RlmB [Bacteroidetes bacterium]|nr:23S rRNA (guanosine(2251)-2'-O)-methyltransferase RlmB [Bacteroidota bacterium]
MQEFRHRAPQKKRENMIYGIHPVLEALEAGKEIEKIMLQRDGKSNAFREIMSLATRLEVPLQKVPSEKLDNLTRGAHQGVVAFVSLVDYQPIENILMGIYDNGESPLLIILDRVTDVRNLGAIARTAECAGVHALIVPSRGSALINADAVKTSAGALNNIAVHRSPNLKETLQYLKDSGLCIVAVTEHASNIYYQSDLSGPLVLILGSEEDGISPEYLKYADKKVQIPLFGSTGSLNVSVAAGIAIFETLRQRNSSNL